VKAEEYEAAVNALLEALGLDAATTLEVRVQPHKATAKVRASSTDRSVYTHVVIERDDSGDEAKRIANAQKFAALFDHITTVNAAKVEVEALKLSGKATKGPTVTHVKKK
jgi:hypothetical protein